MSKSKYIFIVSMNVKSEFKSLFNEVYDKEHIPYLLEVPGVNKLQEVKVFLLCSLLRVKLSQWMLQVKSLWQCMK